MYINISAYQATNLIEACFCHFLVAFKLPSQASIVHGWIFSFTVIRTYMYCTCRHMDSMEKDHIQHTCTGTYMSVEVHVHVLVHHRQTNCFFQTSLYTYGDKTTTKTHGSFAAFDRAQTPFNCMSQQYLATATVRRRPLLTLCVGRRSDSRSRRCGLAFVAAAACRPPR